MFWFPVIAAGTAAVMLGKALARHWNGELAHSAVHDPKGVYTVARFVTDAPDLVLAVVAGACARELGEPIDVIGDAARTAVGLRPGDGGVDVVRLGRVDGACTLTLTRAWTGPQLDGRAVELLEHLHAVLAAHGAVGELAWFARQDRAFGDGHPYPFAP